MSMILPELWSDNSNVALQIVLSLLKKFKHFIKFEQEESILEVGFASGKNSSVSLLPLLPTDYKEFVAADISLEMVEYARKHCNIPRSKIVQLDITSNIPSELHNRFDHLFGFNTIHMVKKPRDAFTNIYCMLKPGGTAILNFFERMPCDDMYDRLIRHPKWGKYGQEEMVSTYFYSYNPEEDYRRDLEAAGFQNYTFKREPGSHKFPTEEECDNLLTSVNAIIPKIPKNDFDEYIKDFLKEKERSPLVDITYENGKKKVSFNFISFFIVATK